jgi:hypothetical protein
VTDPIPFLFGPASPQFHPLVGLHQNDLDSIFGSSSLSSLLLSQLVRPGFFIMLSSLRPAARSALRQRPTQAQAIRAVNASTWANVKEGPPDAILGITEAFKKDSFGEKINLGVGAYRELTDFVSDVSLRRLVVDHILIELILCRRRQRETLRPPQRAHGRREDCRAKVGS